MAREIGVFILVSFNEAGFIVEGSTVAPSAV